jgi:TolA-binding protein
MTEPTNEIPPQASADDDGARLVPVAESIKYRRRAQQAETRLQQHEQQLNELQTQLERRSDELATAEAQRDEMNMQLAMMENTTAAERLLTAAGAVDLETASLLLGKRVDLAESLPKEDLSRAVEQLLLDKPFLRSRSATGDATMPAMTNSARGGQVSAPAHLATIAQRAAASGNRKDIAEYLRLRRQMSNPACRQAGSTL